MGVRPSFRMSVLIAWITLASKLVILGLTAPMARGIASLSGAVSALGIIYWLPCQSEESLAQPILSAT